MLTHYFLEHDDKEMEEIEVSMKEQKSIGMHLGTLLSRAICSIAALWNMMTKKWKKWSLELEFNRCELPRLNLGTRKQTLKELQEDDEETKKWKEKLRKLKNRKKDERIEEEMSNPSFRTVCIEALNEDDRVWKAKKRKIEVEKRASEEEEECQRKRILRLAEAEEKKRELLKTLTLYRVASDPTYLERGRADSARTSVLGQRCPDRPNDDSPPNFWCQCGLQKKNWVNWPKIVPVVPI